ncbi:MAG TPA: HYR domain-containing protein [Gaiellaceae bacterium]|nr:HYR domain-containing protein [Gaiellaceae bacterium]
MNVRRAASRILIAIAGGKSAATAAGATLATALWLGATVPSLSPVPSTETQSQQLIAISLQSALLGIDDEIGRQPATRVLAAARTLGLSPLDLQGLTPERLRSLAARGDELQLASAPLVVGVHVDRPAAQAVATQAQPRVATHAPDSAPAPQPSSTTDAPAPAGPTPSAVPDTPAGAAAPHADGRAAGVGTAPAPSPPPSSDAPKANGQQSQHTSPGTPVLDFHPDVTAEATGPTGAIVTYALPLARAALAAAVAVSCTPASGSFFPLGSTTVACSAQAAAGETVRESFAVVVRDTTPPVLQLPAGITALADSRDGAVVSFAATATDRVDGSVAPVCKPASGSVFALGSTQVTCTATDAAGNVARSSFTVAVGATPETIPPAISAHADVVAEATSASGAVVTYTLPTATDPVDGDVPVSCLPASGARLPLGSTTVTCTARNAAGEDAQLAFTVTVVDTTPPALELPASISAAATSVDGAAVSFPATATDLVDGSVPTTCLPASGSTFAPGATDVTCSAVDAAGNVGYSSFVVVVGDAPDTAPPTLAAHANVTVEATSASGAAVTYGPPVATDDRDGAVPVSCQPASGSLFPLGSTTVSCSARDTAGNSAATSFTVRVRDSTRPTIAAHADVTVEATDSSGATVAYATPAASDNLDGSVAVSCQPAPGSLFPLGRTTVNCSAQDVAGNSASSSFAVVVADTTPPTVAPHPDVTAEATGPAGATVAFATPAATDNLDGALPVSCQPASGDVFAVGATRVTCSAQDGAGNSANSTFTVSVRDTTPPDLRLPADVEVAPSGPNGAVVTYSASADDVVDGAIAPSCSPASGDQFPLGSTTVTCTATDAAGNLAAGSFVVFVGTGSPPPDTIPPTIAAHGNVSAEATGAGGAAVGYASPTASDNRDGSVAVSCVPASGSQFPLGDTVVTCSAHDAAGNSATSTFTVSVRDTTPPAIAAHANVTVEATGPAGAAVGYSTPTATDVVAGSVSASCLPASGSVFPLGATTVACSARDGAGNTAGSTFTVTVRDTTPPTIGAHANVTVEATGPAGAAVGYSTPTAADVVDGSVSVACLPAAGAVFPLGTTTVTCSARDAAGNSASTSFTVRVGDTTAPTLQVPAGLTVDATAASGAVVTFAATATDAVDGTDAVTCLPASGATFAIGHTTVTCSAQDAAGNAATKTFDVLVQGAAAQLTELNQLITAMQLDHKFSDSLTSKVNKASDDIAHGNTGDANKQLTELTKAAIDEVAKASSRLTVDEGAAIAAAANRVRVVIGTVSPSSVIPPAEAALFEVTATIDGLGLGGSTADSLRTSAGHAGDQLVAGDVHGACTTLDGMLTTANSRLTQAQRAVFVPAVDAVEEILGC